MNCIFQFITSILLILISGNSTAQEPELITKLEGFRHPESVVQDSVNSVLYVSNIGDKNEGDGFISKVGLDGKNLELKFISQLNDPKGLLLQENILWVTDRTDVVVMDVNAAKVIIRIPVEGAQSLNDITVDKAGALYFSDMGNHSIFKRGENGIISKWINSEELGVPNGLLAVDDKLFVADWGETKNSDLRKVNLKDRSIEKVTNKEIGNLDGIQQVENKEFYISDWDTGIVYRIDENGNIKKVLTSEKSAGDILFLKQENQLVLPMNHQNSLCWYQIK